MTQTTKPEDVAIKLAQRADYILDDVAVTINRLFPTEEYRNIMWIAIYERCKKRIKP